MKAIILAAGVGSRLEPITTVRPKHLLEIGGKAILKRIIDPLLQSSDVDELFVVVNHHSDQIIEALELWYPDNMQIVPVSQPEIRGTGDAVDTVLQQKEITDNFIVVNGDVVFGEDIGKFLESYTDGGLIVGAYVDHPENFGVLEHTDYNLDKIVEKPNTADSNAIINAGFYIFPKSTIPYFNTLGLSERGERELTDVVVKMIENDEKITVYPSSDGWFDIGFPWKILDANEFFMDKEQHNYQILGKVEENVQFHGNVHVAETARIRSGVYIEGPVYIDEGADIGPNCYIRGSTYLGKKSRVGNACEVKNSVIYENTHAAHLSYVGDSVLGRSCNLGAGTITANLRHDSKNIKMTVKDKRIDTERRKLGVIMGDNVKTGIGVNILPGVKISSNIWLSAGEVISRDRD